MRGHDDGLGPGCGFVCKDDRAGGRGRGGGGGGGGGGGAPANTPQANAAQVAAAGQGGANALQVAPLPGAGGITPQAFTAAFTAAPGSDSRTNRVSMANFREELGGTRAEQDAAIKTMVGAQHFTLDTHESFTRTLTPRDLANAIYFSPDANGRYTGPDGRKYRNRYDYISRR